MLATRAADRRGRARDPRARRRQPRSGVRGRRRPSLSPHVHRHGRHREPRGPADGRGRARPCRRNGERPRPRGRFRVRRPCHRCGSRASVRRSRRTRSAPRTPAGRPTMQTPSSCRSSGARPSSRELETFLADAAARVWRSVSPVRPASASRACSRELRARAPETLLRLHATCEAYEVATPYATVARIGSARRCRSPNDASARRVADALRAAVAAHAPELEPYIPLIRLGARPRHRRHAGDRSVGAAVPSDTRRRHDRVAARRRTRAAPRWS